MNRTKKTIIGVIGGVIVVALVCVLAFVLPKNSDKEAVVSTTTTTVSETTTNTEKQTEADTTVQPAKEEPTASKITTTTHNQKTHTYADYTKKLITMQKSASTTIVVNAGTMKGEAVVQTKNRTAVDEYSDTIKSVDYENDKVVATVNGEAIYQSEVIEEKANLDLQINSNLSQLNYNKKQEKAYIDEWSKTEDEVLEQLIRNRVIVQKAKEAGITPPTEDYVNTQTSSLVNVIKQDEYYYKKLLSSFGMTEDKYFEKTKKKIESTYYNSQFKAKYAETLGSTDYTEINQKYEKHVDELVAKADIKYM